MPRNWLRNSMHTPTPSLRRAKSVQDRLAGYLGVSSRSDIRRWTEEDIHLVRMVGDLLARLLDHREHLHLMKQQEQRLRDIFGGAGVGMAVTDPSGVILEANRQMEELLGYQPGDLVGLSMQALTHPGDYPRERDLIRSIPLSRDEPVLFEKRLVRKNGEMIWVRSTVSFIRDEHRQPRLTIGTVEDISNRKQSESDLHQRQAILEAVAAAADLAVDPDLAGLDQPTSLDFIGKSAYVVTLNGGILRVDGL